ncbi:hypothetical protein PTTG_12272, partial [Puccinia triticina 1-1 BBBD Race 1]
SYECGQCVVAFSISLRSETSLPADTMTGVPMPADYESDSPLTSLPSSSSSLSSISSSTSSNCSSSSSPPTHAVTRSMTRKKSSKKSTHKTTISSTAVASTLEKTTSKLKKSTTKLTTTKVPSPKTGTSTSTMEKHRTSLLNNAPENHLKELPERTANSTGKITNHRSKSLPTSQARTSPFLPLPMNPLEDPNLTERSKSRPQSSSNAAKSGKTKSHRSTSFPTSPRRICRSPTFPMEDSGISQLPTFPMEDSAPVGSLAKEPNEKNNIIKSENSPKTSRPWINLRAWIPRFSQIIFYMIFWLSLSFVHVDFPPGPMEKCEPESILPKQAETENLAHIYLIHTLYHCFKMNSCISLDRFLSRFLGFDGSYHQCMQLQPLHGFFYYL